MVKPKSSSLYHVLASFSGVHSVIEIFIVILLLELVLPKDENITLDD